MCDKMLSQNRISFDSTVCGIFSTTILFIGLEFEKIEYIQYITNKTFLGSKIAFARMQRFKSLRSIWLLGARICCLYPRNRKGDRMIRICAWCRQEGKAGILGRNSPESEEIKEPESHGICPDHGLRLRQTFRRNLSHRPLSTATLSPSSASF